MKKILDIDIDEYFQWYANWVDWKNVTADEIKTGKAGVSPYGMFSDWVKTKAVRLKDSVGKMVYYPLNAEHKDAITTDVWLEGVSIHYGRIEKVEETTFREGYMGYIVMLDGKQYCLSNPDANTTFFEEKDLLLSTLHYDGDYIYDGITLIEQFNNNLYEDETEYLENTIE